MNIQELQTIKTYQLPITIIVLNNAGYVSIRQTHENFFGHVVGADANSGVEFPDYAAVAQAYGLRAVRIAEPKALDAMEAWVARRKGLLIAQFDRLDAYLAEQQGKAKR